MVDIKGLKKAAVLAALYNASHPQGMGYLHYTPVDMTIEEAEKLLQDTTYFDYIKGRVMKVDLSDDGIDERLYDRDNGSGAAQRAINRLKQEIGLIEKPNMDILRDFTDEELLSELSRRYPMPDHFGIVRTHFEPNL